MGISNITTQFKSCGQHQNLRTQFNALRADVTSLKTAVDLVDPLVEELAADHATSKTLQDELIADHATFKTVVDAIKVLVNDIRTYLTGDRLFSGNPALAISSNFDVANGGAVVVSIDGVLKTVGASTVADTGTSATFAAGTWGVALITASDTDTLVVTWDTNSGSGYASEALAIAALPAAPASQAPVGYVTVQAHAGNSFTAGTDALTTGTGGNVAQATNYYNLADPASTISAAISASAPATLSAAAPATLSATTTITAVGALTSSDLTG